MGYKIITGIYQIQSKIKPEKIYIGSAINIKDRVNKHFRLLRKNKHTNKKLQNHFNKHGESDLKYSLIVGCSKENLIAYEQFYIDALDPWFNIRKIAENNTGLKHTIETKKRISERLKGRISPNKGRPMSEAAKMYLSEIFKGRHFSDKTKRKLSETQKGKSKYWLKGRKLSEEVIKKISDAKIGSKNPMFGRPSPNTGKVVSEKTREKIRLSQLGKHHSEDQNKKHSDLMKGSNNPMSRENILKRQKDMGHKLSKTV